MNKRYGVVAAIAMILGGLGIMGASPASATHSSCNAQGTATLSVGIGLPPSSTSASFTLSSNIAVCTNGSSVSANGTLTGACGLSSGSGNATLGNAAALAFQYQSAASVLVITGGITGTVNAFADPTVANNSCASGTAKVFQVQGAVAHV